MSTLPSVSRHISSAVVARWIAGLAGFSNCCGMKYRWSLLASSSALAMAPGMPSAPGVSTISAPKARNNIRRSTLMVSGMVSTQLVATGRGHQRQGDAGVAARRLENDRVRLDQTRLLGRVDHRDPDAVLDTVCRVEELQLGDDVGDRTFGDPVEPDQRGVTDQFRDVLRDAHLPIVSNDVGPGLGLPANIKLYVHLGGDG